MGTAATQTIGGSTSTAFGDLTINKTSGSVSLNLDTTFGTLTLSSGNITTNANTLTVQGAVSRTSGHVVGVFKKFVLSGNNIFEIGTPTAYMPVSVTLSGIGGPGGTLTSSMTAATHPNLGTSGINTSKYINRDWTLTAGGGLTVSSYNATFTFANPGDLVGGPNTGALVVRKFNGSTWSAPSSSSSTATTATGTGFTSFSDFAVGELDTTAPTVRDVTSPVPNGPYATGAVIPIQVVFSEVVNVTGTPHLTLATGSPSATPVNYASGSGTTTLTFNYTVAAGNT